VRAGDTFYLPEDTDPGHHLWTIISDPDKNPEKIIAVCFSTLEDYKDQACIVQKGEHPKIDHPSIVDYSNPATLSIVQLAKMHAAKAIEYELPLSPELLKKVRRGVGISRLPMGLIVFLDGQGVL
jgi:hypothetical protein